MEIREAIYNRRATREFTNTPVEEQIIRELIDAAIQAPSAVNQQPWLFCAIQDAKLLERISLESKQHMLKASPLGLLSHHFEQLLNDDNFNIFYRAPVLIVICSTTAIPWAVEDCALAAQNLMLAAHAAKLGTCWIGFAQTWLGTPAGKALLRLPSECVPVAPIIVGYPKSAPAPVSRKPAQILWRNA